MNPATVCASAPWYAVCTVTVAFSVFGYCRTVRLVTARRPSTRISRLTTMAITGFLMKRSVNFMSCSLLDLLLRVGAAADQCGFRFGHFDATGTSIALNASVFLWRRVRVVGRLELVVHLDRRAVLQLQLAAGHDLRAFGDAAQDGHFGTAGLTGGDEGLPHHQRVRRRRLRLVLRLAVALGRARFGAVAVLGRFLGLHLLELALE